MSLIKEVFSLRIVIVDFYIEKPAVGMDPCFSEFRGKELKRVPIIRIFGSNAEGQKTCMHVHGVFPYLYIPYEKKEFESLDKAIYLIASSIDKAINISLGQGSSSSQHVFKIQLVKGIPFYGYHRKEHQFFKIYMLNPRFVRRAANLLQNGAILGKTFHPHESHVPYILQFMIDYNLYGMSFLHVPRDIVKFRRTSESEEIQYSSVKEPEILDCIRLRKVSTSELEVDIGSAFILNRFQLVTKNSAHTNPGIESIWNDEKIRREKLADKTFEVPALEIPSTYERPNVRPTDSEVFYRQAVISKLETIEMGMTGSSDQTINETIDTTANSTLNPSNTSSKEQKRTFNLKKLLVNAVYPEECTQNDLLTNASFIENHLSSHNLFETISSDQFTEAKSAIRADDDGSVFLDDTIIDEELVLSLTQQSSKLNESLLEQDIQLLNVLQELEEDNSDRIDLDSSLAPLTQQHCNFDTSPESLENKTIAADENQQNQLFNNDSESELDDEGMHDFTMVMDDIDELISKLSQNAQPTENQKDAPTKFSQIDGADDLLRTPKKTRHNQHQHPTSPRTPRRTSTIGSPRSPRSPRTTNANNAALKYAPLPLIINNNHSEKKGGPLYLPKRLSDIVPTNGSSFISSASAIAPEDNSADNSASEIVSASSEETKFNQRKVSKLSLRKKLALIEMKRKKLAFANNHAKEMECPITKEFINETCSSRKSRDLDKTHVTCALTPKRRSERKLKVYSSTKEDADAKVTTVSPQKETIPPEVCKPKQTTTKLSQPDTDCIETNEPFCYTKDDMHINERKLRIKIKRLKFNTEAQRSENQYNNIQEQQEPNIATTIKTNNTEKECVTEIQPTAEQKVRNRLTLKRLKSKRTFNDRSSVKAVYEKQEEQKINFENFTDAKSLPSATDYKNNLIVSDRKNESSIITDQKNPHATLKAVPLLPSSSTESCRHTQSYLTPVGDNRFKKFSENKYLERTEIEDDSTLYSLSENSFAISPSVFSEETGVSSSLQCISEKDTPVTVMSSSSDKKNVIITPLLLPPTYDEVKLGCRKFEIHEYEYQQPFYSNCADVTHKKEIGHTVLSIPGNSLNDCEEFRSVLGADLKGLNQQRKQRIVDLGGPAMPNRFRTTECVREFLATNAKIVITPNEYPPSMKNAKIWIKARELLQAKNDMLSEQKDEVSKAIIEDSPIKIRRQKVTLMMTNESESVGYCGGGEEELDCSTRSITLTPMTPYGGSPPEKVDHSFTPITTTTESQSAVKRKRRSLRGKRSLLKKLDMEHDRDSSFKNTLHTVSDIECVSSQNQLENQSSVGVSQLSSEIISSQTALAQLERSSFLKHLQSSSSKAGRQHENSFGISSSFLNNSFGFKVNLENLQQARADVEYNYLTTLIVEVFVPTRDNLLPNPDFDSIQCIFYAIENSVPKTRTGTTNDDAKDNVSDKISGKACGYIIVDQDGIERRGRGKFHGIDSDIQVKVVNSELECLQALLELCAQWDPDIFAGYEIEMCSWGYIMDRAKMLQLNITQLLSRVPTQKARDFVDEDRDHFTDLDVEMKLCGRILLDVWRLMRSEIALTSYTFENVLYHILHRRCPWHSYRELTNWFALPSTRWIVLEYYLERVRGTVALLDQLDLIGRTSEMAKLIGIQFYEVLSRGSQFRVESMMLRIAKPKNLVPLSPSVQQRAHMRAPEYLALIMEPQSRYYADPLIVLDFQSLYPSMIIAYNYCFSTCLGRVEHLGQSTPFEFGASQLRVPPKLLRNLINKDLITISPCGVVFVKREVREGILPRMLTEILDTRQMVKQSMKLHKGNSALQRILHSRQLGLKLMANVTYGYTAANFSGRMPSVEVGDTVVSKGRETLERAIKMVEANEKWNVKVVYGDTDSLFVLVPGRSRADAFAIGAEIAEAVTQDNPHPVKLKLEKVYQPCILQTKKRYVGYMYETPDQVSPVYEAKGIETVRRDGCPAVQKILEKCLRILFETADVSLIKKYVCRQFTKLLSGRANIQDLIFAKEFRGLNGYKPTACVPALEMTRKWMQSDPRKIPRRGERVPFIITNGPPGVPLIRLVRSPQEILLNEGLQINAIYYITKAIIPPLNRCLLLIGADVSEWFTNLPRKILINPTLSLANNEASSSKSVTSKKSTISQYFSTTNCVIDCGRHTQNGICSECGADPIKTIVTLQSKIAKFERAYYLTQQICQSCCGRVGDTKCGSLDCPVLYVLEVKRRDLKHISHFQSLLELNF